MDEGFEVLEKAERYRSYARVFQYRFRHRLFAGGWSAEISREVFERGHAAAVLPYDPEADAVVLIEQFRIGAWAADFAPWQVEIVAGIVEEDEAVEEVARREAVEEAGATIATLIPICRYLVSPGVASESVALYCGRVDSRGLGGIHGLAEEHEDIRVEVVPWAKALAQLEAGSITNAVTIIALQWLALNREKVREAWR
jgi:ADP-ribose pyrophosphatase